MKNLSTKITAASEWLGNIIGTKTIVRLPTGKWIGIDPQIRVCNLGDEIQLSPPYLDALGHAVIRIKGDRIEFGFHQRGPGIELELMPDGTFAIYDGPAKINGVQLPWDGSASYDTLDALAILFGSQLDLERIRPTLDKIMGSYGFHNANQSVSVPGMDSYCGENNSSITHYKFLGLDLVTVKGVYQGRPVTVNLAGNQDGFSLEEVQPYCEVNGDRIVDRLIADRGARQKFNYSGITLSEIAEGLGAASAYEGMIQAGQYKPAVTYELEFTELDPLAQYQAPIAIPGSTVFDLGLELTLTRDVTYPIITR